MGFTPTGPGRVEESTVTLPLRGIQALLFNFDINGTTAKPEHRKWLDEKAIPLLVANRSNRIHLRGTASKSGTNAVNMAVSEKRVNAVRDHLLARNVQSGQVDFVFTGEELSVSTSNEDQRDRAVFAFVETSAVIGNVRFARFNPLDTQDGFDDATLLRPAQCMTPWTGIARVRVLGGQGATLHSRSPGVAQPVNPDNPAFRLLRITEDPEVIGIQGLSPGSTTIEARDGNRVLARLEVAVLAPRTISTAFHFVRGNGIATARPSSSSQLNDFVAEMNRIYRPQTNLEFNLSSVGFPVINGIAGSVVRTTLASLNGDWPTVVGNRSSGTIFNVFFVRALDATDSAGDEDAITEIGGRRNPVHRDCIFEDSDSVGPNDMPETLAHEAGHGLGEADVPADISLLMNGTTDLQGRKILVEQAIRMHRNLVNFP